MPTSYSNSNSHMQAPLEGNFNPPPSMKEQNCRRIKEGGSGFSVHFTLHETGRRTETTTCSTIHTGTSVMVEGGSPPCSALSSLWSDVGKKPNPFSL